MNVALSLSANPRRNVKETIVKLLSTRKLKSALYVNVIVVCYSILRSAATLNI